MMRSSFSRLSSRQPTRAATRRLPVSMSAGKRLKASQAGQQAAATRAPPVVVVGRRGLASRLWTSYQSSLESHPLTTKMSVAAIIFFTSDSVTQSIMHPEEPWDGARASSGAIFGCVATAYLHYWWGFLETTLGSLIPVARHKLANTAVKVVIDQGCGAPLYIYSYYIVTNTIQQLSNDSTRTVASVLEETEAKARQMLWPTMLKHWKVWPFVHSLNFYYIPLQHRVVVQNTVLVGWSGYLSHLNNTGLSPSDDGKLMTPKEEIESTIQRRQTEENRS